MADNPDALRIGAAGKAYVAELGSVAPLGIDTYVGPTPGPESYTPILWASDWNDLGLISEDGLTEALDEDRNEWQPWGYNSPVRTQITKESVTFKLTCWETNAHVLSLRYRTDYADMTEVSPKEVHFTQVQRTAPDIRAFGFDIVDGDNHFRIVVPRAEVTERGDVVYKSDETVGYEFTVTALPASNGESVFRMLKAGIELPA